MGCCFGKRDDELPPAFDPTIGLCEKLKAPGVTVNGLQISGTGSILGDSPVLQDKGYFEVTLVSEGTWSVGVATRDTALEGVLSQEKTATAWTLVSGMDGLPPLSPGVTLGVALDQGDYPVQIYFYLDGKVVHQISGIRGEVLPAFSISSGAVLEPNFGSKPYTHACQWASRASSSPCPSCEQSTLWPHAQAAVKGQGRRRLRHVLSLCTRNIGACGRRDAACAPLSVPWRWWACDLSLNTFGASRHAACPHMCMATDNHADMIWIMSA